jgi:hypothetical protein
MDGQDGQDEEKKRLGCWPLAVSYELSDLRFEI